MTLKNGGYTITAYGELAIPIEYALLSYVLTYRTQNLILYNATFNLCEVMNVTPKFLQLWLGIWRSSAKNVFRPCPLMPVKKFGVENLPTDSFNALRAVIQFRVGDYLANISVTDKRHNLITYIHSYCAVSSRRSGK